MYKLTKHPHDDVIRKEVDQLYANLKEMKKIPDWKLGDFILFTVMKAHKQDFYAHPMPSISAMAFINKQFESKDEAPGTKE